MFGAVTCVNLSRLSTQPYPQGGSDGGAAGDADEQTFLPREALGHRDAVVAADLLGSRTRHTTDTATRSSCWWRQVDKMFGSGGQPSMRHQVYADEGAPVCSETPLLVWHEVRISTLCLAHESQFAAAHA